MKLRSEDIMVFLRRDGSSRETLVADSTELSNSGKILNLIRRGSTGDRSIRFCNSVKSGEPATSFDDSYRMIKNPLLVLRFNVTKRRNLLISRVNFKNGFCIFITGRTKSRSVSVLVTRTQRRPRSR